MLNLPVRFTRNHWNCLPSSFMLLIVSVTICFFYSFELKGNTNSLTQLKKRQFPIQKKWGTISALPQGLKVEITQLAPKEKVLIPRMNNRLKMIYLSRNTKKIPLTLKPGIEEWEIQIPKTVQSPSMSVIIEFKEPPYLPLKPNIIQENQNQQLILDAKDAVVYGKLLRYEPQPHKNTIGYWANENDWCEWKLNLKTPGIFNVYLLQGCGKGQGGSKVKLSVNDRGLNFIVDETGHFQNFKERHLGTLTIDKTGLQSLQLKPQHKARNAVMDVRQIRLVRQQKTSP